MHPARKHRRAAPLGKDLYPAFAVICVGVGQYAGHRAAGTEVKLVEAIVTGLSKHADERRVAMVNVDLRFA